MASETLVIIGSGTSDGFLPVRHQAITWNNNDFLWIGSA